MSVQVEIDYPDGMQRLDSWPEYHYSFLQLDSDPNENETLILLTERGAIIGYACCERRRYIDSMILTHLYVAEARRRSGLGSTLLETVEKICSQENFSLLKLYPACESIPFYYKRGFFPAYQRDTREYVNFCKMEKSLTPNERDQFVFGDLQKRISKKRRCKRKIHSEIKKNNFFSYQHLRISPSIYVGRSTSE